MTSRILQFAVSLAITVVICPSALCQGQKDFLNVTSLEVPPYLMIGSPDNNTSTASSAGEYIGFIPDFLEYIADQCGFTYEIHLAPDGKYGHDEGGTWVGMIGEVVNGDADIAAAPLTITQERDKVVDFTHAFKSFEAVAVIQKRHPKADEPINTLQDLLDNDFEFGVLKDSIIIEALEASPKDVHKEVRDKLSYKDSNQDGVDKARSDDEYAFILEGSAAELPLRQPPCDLQAIETGVYKRKYAFAIPDKSPLRDRLNHAIVEAQHDGTLDQLVTKWWGEDLCAGAVVTKMSAVVTMFACLVALLLRH